MVCGRGMGVAGVAVDPAKGLPRLDPDADRVEPDHRAVAAATHRDLHHALGPGSDGPAEGKGGGQAATEPEQCAPGRCHLATRASSATCQRTMCACGTSTPGWPAL